MLRARLSLPLSLLVLGGCFGAHSTGEDAGPSPIPDGGELWVDCFDALRSGSEGQPCAFTDSCGEPRCGESGRELLCLSGQLHFVERICTLGPWESCEDYLAHDGVPGSPCVPGTFGSCSSPVEAPAEEPCCTRQARCDPDSWLTVEEVDCIGCGEPELCEDYAPPPPEHPSCRSTSECTGGAACVPAGTPPGCGICQPATRECESRFACDPGYVCVEELARCACDGEPSSFCRPVCAEGSCPEGERCADVCEPIPCDEAYACPANTFCAGPDADPPGPVDAHGCARLGCESDADCDCGACVEGLCQSGPGYCQPPAP